MSSKSIFWACDRGLFEKYVKRNGRQVPFVQIYGVSKTGNLE